MHEDYLESTVTDIHPLLAIGDFDWKPSYDAIFGAGWSKAPPTTTTTAATAPTRALAFGGPETTTPGYHDRLQLPGPPHHALVHETARLHHPAPRPRRRLTHTAGHARLTRIPDDVETIQHSVDQQVPCTPAGASLTDRWATWHARAEQTL